MIEGINSTSSLLDVFVTRTDHPVVDIRVDPSLLSDHSLIVVSFNATHIQPSPKTTTMRRRWRTFNYYSFESELMTSMLVNDPPTDVSDLFECYDTTLVNLLDKHAPYHSVKAKLAILWFDIECRAAKVKIRKLEKVYRRKISSESEIAWRTQFKAQA